MNRTSKELVIRINCPATTTWGIEDLKMVHALSTMPTAVLLPKVNHLQHIDSVLQLIPTNTKVSNNNNNNNNGTTSNTQSSSGQQSHSLKDASFIPIWAMIETTQGVINAEAIASSTSVTALVFGSNDLTKELKAKHTPSREPLLYAMSKTINAARSYNKYVIDGVHLDIQDADGLRTSCIQGRNLGFDGKSLIHPNQVEITNECFSPSESEISLAERIVTAYTEAMSQGKGVCTVDGKMVEYLHVCNAQYILDTTKLIRNRQHK